jgi:hypothetical protein
MDVAKAYFHSGTVEGLFNILPFENLRPFNFGFLVFLVKLPKEFVDSVGHWNNSELPVFGFQYNLDFPEV